MPFPRCEEIKSAMTEQDHDIDVIALQCQQTYRAWADALDPTVHAARGDAHRQSLERLWEAIAPDLRKVAHGWIRSGMAPDIESLALNMFSYIVFKLPTLSFNLQRNVRGLLVTVARRGLIDEYRRSYAVSSKRQPRQFVSLDDKTDLADDDRSDIEGTSIHKIDGNRVLTEVQEYWRSLNPEETLIMRLRWQTDPPCSFREIAQQMGSGWVEDAVRQRHHRIMNATRKHLHDRKLLGEQPEL